MADQSHEAALRKGSAYWNSWYQTQKKTQKNFKADLTSAKVFEYRADLAEQQAGSYLEPFAYRVDLRGVDLSSACLEESDLSGVDLSAANLTRAELKGAKLRNTVLVDAILRHADLTGASLLQANLQGADFTSSDATGADLRQSDLRDAILSRTKVIDTALSGARVGGTTFSDLDLSKASGLDSLLHLGGSSISFDVLIKSGKLPETFLARIGVPADLLSFLQSQDSSKRELHSCFISHAVNARRKIPISPV